MLNCHFASSAGRRRSSWFSFLLITLALPLVARGESSAGRQTNFPSRVASVPVASWGKLEIQRIPLEKSDQVFLDRAERLQKPAWHFDNFSPAQLIAFFESCNFGPFAHSELLKTNQWLVQSNSCVVFPSDELILKLTPSERQRVYDVLSRNEK